MESLPKDFKSFVSANFTMAAKNNFIITYKMPGINLQPVAAAFQPGKEKCAATHRFHLKIWYNRLASMALCTNQLLKGNEK